MRLIRRSTGALVCALALAALLPVAASAAPRISGVSIPSPVPGYSGAAFGTFCNAEGPVPMTFTASAPGTMSILTTGPSIIPIRWSSFRFRKGANTVDLHAVVGFYGGSGQQYDRWKLTFTPLGQYFDPGSTFSRSVHVKCW